MAENSGKQWKTVDEGGRRRGTVGDCGGLWGTVGDDGDDTNSSVLVAKFFLSGKI